MADWPGDKIELLRRLWGEKCTIAAGPDATTEVSAFSTNQIAIRMGISKNAVVGKAHRLDLPRRPSPIGREGPKTPRAIYEKARRLRQREASLAPLPSIAEPHTVAGVAPSVSKANGSKAVETERPPPVAVAAKPPVAATPRIRVHPKPVAVKAKLPTCFWPIGDPKTKQFRFCDAPRVPGRPYCKDHCKIAYLPARDTPQPPKEPTHGATRID